MRNFKNLNQSFDILGLDYNTSFEDVKKAYHKLAKQYHPDKIKNQKEKENAEKKFIEIKKAYDDIVEYFKNNKTIKDEELYDNNFSDFFKNEELKKEDNFYKTYGFNTTNSRKEIISDFERYIKNNKISQYDVFMAIYKNEPIYKDKIGYKVNEMLMKDNIYRSHLKLTPEYMKFQKNINLLKNLDIDINVYYDPVEYENKQLNFNLDYNYKSICNICSGWGCTRCNEQGFIIKHKKLNVKIPKCNNKKTVLVKQKGNISPWKNGDIKINLIAKQNLLKQKNVGFEYKIKKTNSSINKEIPVKLYQEALKYIKQTYDFLYKHKIHTLYISAIVLLVIIIILLACLL